MAGLADPKISRAMSLMHDQPAKAGASPNWPRPRMCPVPVLPSISGEWWGRRRWIIW